MSGRDWEIKLAEQELKFYQNKVAFYRHIQQGRTYLFKLLDDYYGSFIGRPLRYNKSYIMFEVLACENSVLVDSRCPVITHEVGFDDGVIPPEVKYDELPMYLGWKYISSRFQQMIKRGYISRDRGSGCQPEIKR